MIATQVSHALNIPVARCVSCQPRLWVRTGDPTPEGLRALCGQAAEHAATGHQVKITTGQTITITPMLIDEEAAARA